MKHVALLAGFLLIACAAQAQTYQVVASCDSVNNSSGAGSGLTGYMDTTGHVCIGGIMANAGAVSGVTAAMTATTSTVVVAAPATGFRNYLTSCTFVNTHATVATQINLQDGSGGTVIWTAAVAAVSGTQTITWPTGLRQPTLATGLYAVNVTTGSNTFVACNGFKSPL
jgi:hypothetical protein